VRLRVVTLRHVTCALCSNIPEADAPWHRLLSVERLQLCPEEVSREPETAGRLVKDGDQVVGDDVTIRICNICVYKNVEKICINSGTITSVKYC
jgi:hypothetical protein